MHLFRDAWMSTASFPSPLSVWFVYSTPFSTTSLRYPVGVLKLGTSEFLLYASFPSRCTPAQIRGLLLVALAKSPGAFWIVLIPQCFPSNPSTSPMALSSKYIPNPTIAYHSIHSHSSPNYCHVSPGFLTAGASRSVSGLLLAGCPLTPP